LILPLSGTLSTMLDVVVSLCLMVVMFIVFRVPPGLALLTLPIWVALILCLALGIGLIAASMTVDYRDVQHILPVLVPFLLYASPVAYEASALQRYRTAFFIVNPLASLIEGFRWSLLHTTPPSLPYVAWSTFVSLSLFMLGTAVFRRTERKAADVI
jgi:lipopolysaccharide transport system permease protein